MLRDPMTGRMPTTLSNKQKLRIYALFKVATKGPCPARARRPSFWDAVGRAKFDAYKALANITPTEAKRLYVEHLTSIVPDWAGSDPAAGGDAPDALDIGPPAAAAARAAANGGGAGAAREAAAAFALARAEAAAAADEAEAVAPGRVAALEARIEALVRDAGASPLAAAVAASAAAAGAAGGTEQDDQQQREGREGRRAAAAGAGAGAAPRARRRGAPGAAAAAGAGAPRPATRATGRRRSG